MKQRSGVSLTVMLVLLLIALVIAFLTASPASGNEQPPQVCENSTVPCVPTVTPTVGAQSDFEEALADWRKVNWWKERK